MSIKRTAKNGNSLFWDEEEHLLQAYKLLERSNDKSIDWVTAYREMTSRYGKLLQHTSKLVKISDHAQKNLKKANSKIQEMADTDNLTGLLNRRGARKLIEEEVRKCYRNQTSLALFLMDIDYFKTVNDTWGHMAGDRVLKELAKDMRNNLRVQDILGRWGGEEFILILPDTNQEGANTLSEKIRRNIEKTPIKAGEEKLKITMSLGGTFYDFSKNLDRNLDYADRALYKSKQNGRNRITFYEN